MAGSRSQINKSHKSRYSSKSSLQIHRTAKSGKGRNIKAERNVAKGARASRIQRNKMVRDQKRAAFMKERRATSGSVCPPRVIVLFGLSKFVDTSSLANDILTVLSPVDQKILSDTVASPIYKLRTTVLEAPHGDLLSCMEMAKVADLIVFTASAASPSNGSETNDYIDSFGSLCLSVFRALGLPNTVVFIRDLPNNLKQRHDWKKMCISNIAREFPEDCKFYPADSKDELHKFMCLFKEQRISTPHWRNHRPYLLAQKVNVITDGDNPGKSTLLLSGYIRSHHLSVNQLIHVSGVGDFQLSKIDVLKDPFPMNEKKDQDIMDSDESHDVQILRSAIPDPLRQEPLLVENVFDPLAGEQTWPTEEEMLEVTSKENMRKKKVLPRGTSDYQAAWIIDDSSDNENSDNNVEEDDDMVVDEVGLELCKRNEENYSDSVDDQDSVALSGDDFDEETEADAAMTEGDILTKEEIEVEIQKIKEEHAEDEEFPDEMDTPIDFPAQKRFAKYRGLKSFRTSTWDSKESLPQDYARIFAFDNFSRTQKHVLARASEMDGANMDDFVPLGCFVTLHINEVPTEAAFKLCNSTKSSPIVACGLLQHESKMSVLHFSIKKHDSYIAPIKSKETLIFHVGFRQFVARPIYSTDNINSDKHKMERFLHAGRFSIASIYAPISFPPLPLIALKSESVEGIGIQPTVAAVGSLKSIDPDRIVLKRIILTGYPQRVSKLKATVRFMFHNPDDVRWFHPVEVWTKCGRRGRIKEPVGTHGAMKCAFNGVVQQHDTVCMSLYKRIYPKWPEHLFPTSDS